MNKFQQLRDKSESELVAKLDSLKKEIYEHRSQPLDNKGQKTHVIGQRRKEIARILTALRQKELEKTS